MVKIIAGSQATDGGGREAHRHRRPAPDAESVTTEIAGARFSKHGGVKHLLSILVLVLL
jgi:hypothetical protein